MSESRRILEDEDLRDAFRKDTERLADAGQGARSLGLECGNSD